MKIGDLVVCWHDGLPTPKRIRRLEGIGCNPDGSTYYECCPVAPGFEGSSGCHFDHAEPFDEELDAAERTYSAEEVRALETKVLALEARLQECHKLRDDLINRLRPRQGATAHRDQTEVLAKPPQEQAEGREPWWKW